MLVLIFVFVGLSIDHVILIEIRAILMLYFVSKFRKHARVEAIHGHKNLRVKIMNLNCFRFGFVIFDISSEYDDGHGDFG